MLLLFRLPFLLFELLLRRLFGRDEEQERFAPTSTVAPSRPPEQGFDSPTAPTAAPPSAEEAIERRRAREAAAAAVDADLTPPTPLRPIGGDGHVADEVELVESFGPSADVGGTITVDEPWDGYAAQPAADIVTRLRSADPATKAVVALYERGHKNRATVLRATG